MTDTPETNGGASPRGRRARNRLIVEARGAGASWKEITTRFCISERQARRAAQESLEIAAEEVGLEGIDAAAILANVIRIQLRGLSRLETLMEEADNSNAQVGAAKAVGGLGSDLTSSLTRAGLIPDSGERLRLHREVHQFVEAVLGLAEDLGVTEDQIKAVIGEEPVLEAATLPDSASFGTDQAI